MKRWQKVAAVVLAFFAALWLSSGPVAMYIVTAPNTHPIPERSEVAGYPAESVRFAAADGVSLSAWHVRNGADKAVVFAAGIGANRRQGLSRAALYLERGFSVLLMDLRGTGESDPAPVTIGWDERKDLAAALRFLRDAGYTHVGAHGISLGAATIAYALQDAPTLDFVVLESCYDTLENAWNNRLAMFDVPRFLGWPARWCASWGLGATIGQMRPVAYLPLCTAPALIVAGDAEPELASAETQALYDACGAEHKRLYFFEGGRHENFLGRFPEAYRREFGAFMDGVVSRWEGAGDS